MPRDRTRNARPDSEYIQGKIALIEKGLPIDITEAELTLLEDDLRGARSFSVDLLSHFNEQREAGASEEEIERIFTAESKNLAGIEMALRRLDEFREQHWKNIKHVS